MNGTGRGHVMSGSLPASEWLPDINDVITGTDQVLVMHARRRTRLQTTHDQLNHGVHNQWPA